MYNVCSPLFLIGSSIFNPSSSFCSSSCVSSRVSSSVFPCLRFLVSGFQVLLHFLSLAVSSLGFCWSSQFPIYLLFIVFLSPIKAHFQFKLCLHIRCLSLDPVVSSPNDLHADCDRMIWPSNGLSRPWVVGVAGGSLRSVWRSAEVEATAHAWPWAHTSRDSSSSRWSPELPCMPTCCTASI